MVNLILFALAAIGMTHIIVDGAIFNPVRALLKKILHKSIYKVFECYQCTGVWCGFISGAIFIDTNIFIIIGCGFAGSFLSTFSVHVINYIEAKTIIDLRDDEL